MAVDGHGSVPNESTDSCVERVAEVVVPLGPARGEIPLLLAVPSRSCPRFGDQVDPWATLGRANGELVDGTVQGIVRRELVEELVCDIRRSSMVGSMFCHDDVAQPLMS